jgi:hypothetical protein
MAVLTPVSPGLTGAIEAFVAASAGGDSFPNDGHTMLHVKNGSGASINVTITSLVNCNQGVNHPVVVAVPAASERIIGPFDQTRFGTSVAVAYSAVTTVTVAAVIGA